MHSTGESLHVWPWPGELNYTQILESKNIILIYKLIIHKTIIGIRKINLFWFTDYGYRRETVRDKQVI